jgi:hypothetical protein
MASLVLRMSVSLDGYVAPSDGSAERSDEYLLAHGGARFARSLVETGSAAAPSPTSSRRTRDREPLRDGRYWARTSDPLLVRQVLSQLS